MVQKTTWEDGGFGFSTFVFESWFLLWFFRQLRTTMTLNSSGWIAWSTTAAVGWAAMAPIALGNFTEAPTEPGRIWHGVWQNPQVYWGEVSHFKTQQVKYGFVVFCSTVHLLVQLETFETTVSGYVFLIISVQKTTDQKAACTLDHWIPDLVFFWRLGKEMLFQQCNSHVSL